MAALRLSQMLFLEAGEVGGEPIRLAVQEIRGAPDTASLGGSEVRRVLVFLHGVMSDHTTWQYIAGYLGEFYDLLLVDLPGCGESDKPDPDDLGPDAYNPTWLADTVMTALGHYLRGQDDDIQFTLVGHSLGGTVALRMLAEPELVAKHGEVYERLDSAVLLAPVDVTGIGKMDPTFQTIATLSDFETFLGRAFGILASQTSAAVYFGTSDPETMPREEWLRLYESISNGDTRTAAQWMLRNTLAWDDDLHPIWDGNQVHENHYRDIDVPCLIIWGKRDETMEAFMGYKLHSYIPDSWLLTLPRSKHTLPSERPRVVAEYILRFLQQNQDGGVTPAGFSESTDRIIAVPIEEIDDSDEFKRNGILLLP